MARYIVSYRISRYWGRIMAYLCRDNYHSNEVDIPHNSISRRGIFKQYNVVNVR